MATVFDVAKYVLAKQGPMPHMKLQKLVYYCQAWALVWDDKSLFDNRIEAWANGPVVKDLFAKLKGRFTVSESDLTVGDAANLEEIEIATIDGVLKFYGDKPSQWLSDLTHEERPWLQARGSLRTSDRSSAQITDASMAEYYGSL